MLCPHCAKIIEDTAVTCKHCGNSTRVTNTVPHSPFSYESHIKDPLLIAVGSIFVFLPIGWIALCFVIMMRANIKRKNFSQAQTYGDLAFKTSMVAYILGGAMILFSLFTMIVGSNKASSLGETRMNVCNANMEEIEAAVINYNAHNKTVLYAIDKARLMEYMNSSGFPDCPYNGVYLIQKYTEDGTPIITCSEHGDVHNTHIPAADDDRTLLTDFVKWLRK